MIRVPAMNSSIGISSRSRPLIVAGFVCAWVALFVSPASNAQDEQVFEPGVTLRLYDIGQGMSSLLELVEGQTPNIDVRRDTIDFDESRGDFKPLEDEFIAHAIARLTIAKEGTYRFRLTSDDGSMLLIDGAKIVDNDGLHSSESAEGYATLKAGPHELVVHFFESGGGSMFRLEWMPPGAESFVVVPASVLSTPAGIVRVTAPGKKKTLGRIAIDPPGDGRPLKDVHPSYDLFTCRPESFKPKVGGIDFLTDGRMVVSTWDAEGGVYILDGVNGDDRSKITVSRFAAGLAEPLGVKVVDDRIFVLQKQELTELIDHDKDGVADEYRCVSNLWNVTPNFHEFAFGLEYLDGWFYFNLAIAIDPGGKSTKPQIPNRGRTVRVEEKTGVTEFVTEGLRTPNGIGKGPDGDLFLTDNQGDWLPSSKLLRLEPGAFYGSRAALPDDWQEKQVTPPVVWLPQNEIGNSPGECGAFTGGPFKGQMAVADVTHGGIKRVFVEKVDGVWQGAVFRFTQGLEGGINRMRHRPDGSIFVGGIGSGGNWGQEGKHKYGLQRLRPNGEPSFEMRALRVRSNGIEVEFTEPLLHGLGGRIEDYRVSSWRYEPTAEYGGPKIDVRPVVLKSVTMQRFDCVFLEFDGVEPGRVYYLRLDRNLRSIAHRALWSTEAWYTVNRVPEQRGDAKVSGNSEPIESFPTLDDVQNGVESLFDGKSFASWRGFKKPEMPAEGWTIEDGVIHKVAGKGGGDIITREEFEDFDFECEWRVAPGANSGIMYRVSEEGDATWSTGPEMQVLDDRRHPDGKSPLTSAGALYALIPCRRDASRPAGEWNHARIRIQNGHVEHWLNGVQVVRYVLGDEAFGTMVANSKFAAMPKFGRMQKGHIALQDHGDDVYYRNLKIRRLP